MNKIGVLLIHGFTSHRSGMEPILPGLQARGIKWEYPTLAGHGTRPEELRDKRWPDWQQDVETAYQRLRHTHDQIVIIAMSMGALLGMELAAKYPASTVGLVLISPALVFKNPLAKYTPIVAPLVRRFPFPPKDKFSSREYWAKDRGYQWFPTRPYQSYWQRAKTILDVVNDIRCPVRIIQSRSDHIADPRGAELVFGRLVGEKELLWHGQSGHEMLLDCEAATVVKEILDFQPLKLQ